MFEATPALTDEEKRRLFDAKLAAEKATIEVRAKLSQAEQRRDAAEDLAADRERKFEANDKEKRKRKKRSVRLKSSTANDEMKAKLDILVTNFEDELSLLAGYSKEGNKFYKQIRPSNSEKETK